MNAPVHNATRAFDAWLSKRRYDVAMRESHRIWSDASGESHSVVARTRLANFLRGVFEGTQAAGDQEIARIQGDDINYIAVADKWLRGMSAYDPIKES